MGRTMALTVGAAMTDTPRDIEDAAMAVEAVQARGDAKVADLAPINKSYRRPGKRV
jgi:hypothetical protein